MVACVAHVGDVTVVMASVPCSLRIVRICMRNHAKS